MRALIQDPNKDVAYSAMYGLSFGDVGQVTAMLPFVKLHGSVFAAERLGSVWSMRRNAKRRPQRIWQPWSTCSTS
jgi:hypothetical protein